MCVYLRGVCGHQVKAESLHELLRFFEAKLDQHNWEGHTRLSLPGYEARDKFLQAVRDARDKDGVRLKYRFKKGVSVEGVRQKSGGTSGESKGSPP